MRRNRVRPELRSFEFPRGAAKPLARTASVEAPRGAFLASRMRTDRNFNMTTQDVTQQQDMPNAGGNPPSARGGSIGLVLLVAVAVVASAVGLMLIGRANAGPYILGLLALLAMVGVFALFA